jgi:hypothetical protein
MYVISLVERRSVDLLIQTLQHSASLSKFVNTFLLSAFAISLLFTDIQNRVQDTVFMLFVNKLLTLIGFKV